MGPGLERAAKRWSEKYKQGIYMKSIRLNLDRLTEDNRKEMLKEISNTYNNEYPDW